MLEEFTPLVIKIAGGFQRKLPRTILREDIIAAGMSGLWDAIRRHPDGGDESFEWYVRVRVRGAILDELRSQDWLPRRARATAKAEDTLAPCIVRMEDLSDWEQERILARSYRTEELIDESRQMLALMSYVDELPQRERHIVHEHHFLGVKLKELAAELGISEPRVSQLHSRAIARMKQLAEDNEHGIATGAPPESTDRRRLRVSSR